MDAFKLARYFDHTLLKADATRSLIEKTCQEAVEHHFFSVCTNSMWLPTVRSLLQGSKAKPICVVGFPLGACSTAVKVYETKWCVDSGAEEIDMVLNLGAFKSGDEQHVRVDIESVVKAAQRKPVKVILETGYLSHDEIIRASKICALAGAAFVKTSTGFGPRGATVDDIRAMQQGLKEGGRTDMLIKASGGIRDLSTTLTMIEAGAARVGASASVQILQELAQGKGRDATAIPTMPTGY